jgi:hypothetical protein
MPDHVSKALVIVSLAAIVVLLGAACWLALRKVSR